jgi:transcription antitermination factor NusB
MIDRRPARILAMQALCQLEVLAEHFLPQLDEFLAEEPHKAGVRDYARDLVRDAWAHLAELDQRIQEVAEHWELKRMAAVDRNVLRIAVCELFHRPDVPPAVAIDEAVEIGKGFGTAESGAFINGILDALVKRRESETQPQPEISGATDGTL